MNKKSLLLTAVFCAAVCYALPEVSQQKAWRPVKSAAAQKSVEVKPQIINQTTILAGNKKVALGNDGKIVISNASGEIVTVELYHVFKDSKGHVDWITTTDGLCKAKQNGNKVVWQLWKKHKLETWKVADQTIELLEDGLLKLSAQVHAPQSTELSPRGNSAAFFVSFPVAGNEGKKLIYDGKDFELNGDLKSLSNWKGQRFDYWRCKNFDYNIFADNPAENVIFKNLTAPRTGKLIVGKRHRIDYYFKKDGSCSILIDVRKSADEKADPANIGAGIDFKRIENVELPWRGKRNLLPNSGFEQGFHSWKSHSGYYGEYWKGKWDFKPFEIVNNPYHGKKALLLRGRCIKAGDYRNLRGGINLTSGAMLLQPGKYTMSFYAKTLSGKAKLNVWIHNYNTRSYSTHYLPPDDTGYVTVVPNGKWQRFTKVVNIEKSCPTALSININGDSKVLIDAIQFESGTKATAYEFPAAAGVLLTSSPDNFISSDKKVNARLLIYSKPNVRGKVTTRVKNFFDEIVSITIRNFRTDKAGYSVVNLPLENLGKGLFMVRCDYELADGSKSFDLTRYAVVDFLNNTHRLKAMFSDDYGHIHAHYAFPKILDRWRKVGFGAKTHMYTWDRTIWNKYSEYGVEITNSALATLLWGPGTTKVRGIAVTDVVPPGPRYTTDGGYMIKDHQLENNGKVDDAYFEKLTDAIEKVAAENKHVKCWTLYCELRAKFPNDWWHKDGTDASASVVQTKYLKAVVDGVRKGNPEAVVFQDAPCNMRPDGGIAETAKLLENCNKLGIKFDCLAIHPYRFSPESPDIDADTQLFFNAVKKQGYGDDVKVLWPELMHWGPLNIPQWGTDSSTWGAVPRTWPGWALTYDIAETEKRSAAWRARTWLVALKYSDRITNANSGSEKNNFCLDEDMTPYASQLMSNTLGNILGDCTFKKDIRFAPLVRAYVFEDAQKRPVAAVWCHMEKVDNGYVDAPVAEADFGYSLESVIDLMNNERAFTNGKFRFPVTSYPLFIRGKEGTLDEMIKALEQATIVEGEGISPIEVSVNPLDNKTLRVTLKNFVSGEFRGTFNGKRVVVPGNGEAKLDFPIKKISAVKVSKVPFQGVLKSDKGQVYNYDLSFTAFTAKKVSDDETFDTIDWNALPAVKFGPNAKKETSGTYRLGWNQFGLFVQAEVKDSKFLHNEYRATASRWNNDCLQLYIDTMANARFRQFKGYDEDDYDYAVFPNSKGTKSIVWRNRSVEQQLGLATQAPSDQTVAHDIPSSFSNKNGVLTYRVFFPAKYLLPIKLNSGWVLGFGIYAANSNKSQTVSSWISNAEDNGGCYNRPHVYPALLLED